MPRKYARGYKTYTRADDESVPERSCHRYIRQDSAQGEGQSNSPLGRNDFQQEGDLFDLNVRDTEAVEEEFNEGVAEPATLPGLGNAQIDGCNTSPPGRNNLQQGRSFLDLGQSDTDSVEEGLYEGLEHPATQRNLDNSPIGRSQESSGSYFSEPSEDEPLVGLLHPQARHERIMYGDMGSEDHNLSQLNSRPRVYREPLGRNIEVTQMQQGCEAFGMSAGCNSGENEASDVDVVSCSESGDESSDLETNAPHPAESSASNSGSNSDGETSANDDFIEEANELPQAPQALQPPSHKLLKEMLKTEQFTSPISTPVNASPAEALLMTLKMSQQNNLSFKAFVDSVKLLNSLFLSPVIPNTATTLDKLLHFSDNIMRYFYCQCCSYYFGNVDIKRTPVLECPECKFSNDIRDLTKASYFVLYPLDQQIELLLKNKDIREKLQDPKTIILMCEDDEMKDLYDGRCYKQFVASLGDTGDFTIISFTVCTDGSPLFKSSNFSIWPFFLIINELPPVLRMKNLLLGGLWFGNKKPHMDLYLSAVADHLRVLSSAGFTIHVEGSVTKMKAYCIACCVDSGARGPVQGLNSHSGYYSCNWCEIPGEYWERKVVFPFPEIPPKRRTHNEVRNYAEECVKNERLVYVYGVQYLSCLATLPKFDIVEGMVQDYAHNVPFGISRSFLDEWLSNTSRGYYIGAPDDIEELDQKMKELKPPIEVRRPVRAISERAHFSARDFENWTLHYSLIVLSGILPLKYVTHWSYLVQALFLLSRQSLKHQDINNAHKLLLNFERDTEVLYGRSFMTYNMHILGHHLAENSARWGPCWAVSTFCFESGIKDLKSLIHAQRGVPHQIHRALAYKQAFQILNDACNSPKTECYAAMTASKPNKGTNYFPFPECVMVGTSLKFQPTPEESFVLENSGMDIDVSNSLVYKKVIANNCVYTSDDFPLRKRFNNSCAVTTEGKVILIKKFVCDKSAEKVFVFCVDAICDTFLKWPTNVRISPDDHCLKLVRTFSQRLNLISVQNLKIVCVLTKLNGTVYVGEFPNIYNVF